MFEGEKPGPVGLCSNGSSGIDFWSSGPGLIGLRPKSVSDRRNWWNVQRMVAAYADSLIGQLSVPSGKAVFYTDGLGKVANLWASSNGRVTIDMTIAGKALGRFIEPLQGSFRWVEDLRPGWARLSEQMARQAEGEVHAFVRGLTSSNVRMPQPSSGGERRAIVRGAASVFWEIEYPELVLKLRENSKVTPIIFHMYDHSGKQVETVTEPKSK